MFLRRQIADIHKSVFNPWLLGMDCASVKKWSSSSDTETRIDDPARHQFRLAKELFVHGFQDDATNPQSHEIPFRFTDYPSGIGTSSENSVARREIILISDDEKEEINEAEASSEEYEFLVDGNDADEDIALSAE